MVLSGHASQPAIFISTIALTALSSAAVALRLVTRIAIVRQTGLDDIFISIAWLLSVIMAISICKQATYGMGLHLETLDQAYVENAFEWFWTFFWLYYSTLCFTKLSILLQYLRIFPHLTFTRACHALIVIISVWSTWAVLGSIFTCLPVSRFWTNTAWDTKGCLPRLTVWYLNATFNILTDFATALLPLPIIHQLEIPKQQKLILMAVFAIGFFTCLVSVLRLVYIYPLSTSPDFTWQSPLGAIWSCVEVNTAILCSCVPTLKGLAQRFCPKLLEAIRSQPTPATGSDAYISYASTKGSMQKSDSLSTLTDRPGSLKDDAGKYFSTYSTKAVKPKSSANCFRSDRRLSDDIHSEEGVHTELITLPSDSHVSPHQSFVSVSHSPWSPHNSINVKTSVAQLTRQRRESDPPLPRRFEPTQGRHTTIVSGAGGPMYWGEEQHGVMSDELRHALGMRYESSS